MLVSLNPERKNYGLYILAGQIRKDWKNISPYAAPYLDAMATLDSIHDKYYFDTGKSIVAYFLANAQSWRGQVARELKKELNVLLKSQRKVIS